MGDTRRPEIIEAQHFPQQFAMFVQMIDNIIFVLLNFVRLSSLKLLNIILAIIFFSSFLFVVCGLTHTHIYKNVNGTFQPRLFMLSEHLPLKIFFPFYIKRNKREKKNEYRRNSYSSTEGRP